MTVAPDHVEEAMERIRAHVVRSPLISSPALTRITGSAISLKLEAVQPTGSFKVRGAASKILSMSEEDLARGVVTASTGNHGRAVAHMAGELGVSGVVCVSDKVPLGKVRSLEAAGCEVRIVGDSQDEAMVAARHLVDSEGMTLVHPFDDAHVIAGQGTIGLEILDKLPEVSHVLVPLSGGGLISGIATVVKERSPECEVIGVSMVDGAAMAASIQAGEPVEMPEQPTLADSLQGGIGQDNQLTFEMVRDLVDEVVLVSEQRIWQSMLWVYNNHGVVLEGGGAVGIAALLSGMVNPGANVVVVCSGGNAEPDQRKALGESLPEPP